MRTVPKTQRRIGISLLFISVACFAGAAWFNFHAGKPALAAASISCMSLFTTTAILVLKMTKPS